MITQIFIQMAISLFLQNRVQLPIGRTVNFFGQPYGLLRQSPVPVFSHDKNGRYPFAPPWFMPVHNANGAYNDTPALIK